MIPNVLYFTYKSDLLTTSSAEDRPLAENVRRTVEKVPNATVHFLTDEDCAFEIGRLPRRLRTALLPVFERERRGMIRADICRGAALFRTGGWYLDVDVEVTRDFRLLSERMRDETLLTVLPAWQTNEAYFQAIMGVTRPRDRTVRRYLWLFAQHTQTSQDENTGTLLLRRAAMETGARIYELTEARGPVRLAGGRTRSIPGSMWCNNVVYDARVGDLWFYSRIAKSRMC